MRIYIAGPMRGYPRYNFPAFDEAAEILRQRGHEPVNPADMDRRNGFDPVKLPAESDWSTMPDGMDIREVAREDLIAITYCDALCLLPGWTDSLGAIAEYRVACWLGLPCYSLSGVPTQ